jgi:hypothetical protein
VQVVGCCLRIKLWPERVGHLFPVQPVPFRESEEFEQARRLPESSPVFCCVMGPYRYPESTQQPDAHGLGFATLRTAPRVDSM